MFVLFFARTGGSAEDNLDTLPLPESPQPEESIPPSQPTDAFMISEPVPPDSPEPEKGDNECPPEKKSQVGKLPMTSLAKCACVMQRAILFSVHGDVGSIH